MHSGSADEAVGLLAGEENDNIKCVFIGSKRYASIISTEFPFSAMVR